MEQRNEPTTGEIVRALRCDGDANNCVDCRYATYDTATILCDQEQNVRDAAARLEQLERENAKKDVTIAELTARLGSAEELAEARNVLRVRALQERDEATARAEKAEAERDAAVNALTLYEDALFDECDKSYQSGFMDGFRSREEIDDED